MGADGAHPEGSAMSADMVETDGVGSFGVGAETLIGEGVRALGWVSKVEI